MIGRKTVSDWRQGCNITIWYTTPSILVNSCPRNRKKRWTPASYDLEKLVYFHLLGSLCMCCDNIYSPPPFTKQTHRKMGIHSGTNPVTKPGFLECVLMVYNTSQYHVQTKSTSLLPLRLNVYTKIGSFWQVVSKINSKQRMHHAYTSLFPKKHSSEEPHVLLGKSQHLRGNHGFFLVVSHQYPSIATLIGVASGSQTWPWKILQVLLGKSSIAGGCPIAMFDYRTG